MSPGAAAPRARERLTTATMGTHNWSWPKARLGSYASSMTSGAASRSSRRKGSTDEPTHLRIGYELDSRRPARLVALREAAINHCMAGLVGASFSQSGTIAARA